MNDSFPIQIKKLTHKYVKQVVDVINTNLGRDYTQSHFIKKHINNKFKTALIATYNNFFAGVILYEVFYKKDLQKHLFHCHNSINQILKPYRRIGILKTISIKNSFYNNGIGTLLVKKCFEKLQQNSEIQIIVCWKNKEHIPLEPIMTKLGVAFVQEIQHYWKEDSLSKSYSCKSCETSPCLCNAVIFINK